MITLEQAKALKVGDRVQSITKYGKSLWEVYSPDDSELWPEDETIVKYIRSVRFPRVRSYIFSERLYKFHLIKE